MSFYEATQNENSLTIIFSSDLDLVSRVVKDSVAFLLARTDGVAQFTIKLALYESLTNAVKHGCRADNKLKVKLCIALENSWANITIADEGAGFDWRRQMAYSENPADEECTSGRGIFLLKSYNCHPAYNEKGNVLSLKIELA